MKKFKNELAKFVYMRTYSRYLVKEGRRETWEETVTRVVDYLRKLAGDKLPKKNFEDIYNAILNFEVMPSMRLMWTAGPALDENGFGAYNCSAVICDNIKVFGETMFVLMHGTGLGFSVEEKYVQQLPIVAEATGKTKNFVVEDSKLGWAETLNNIVQALWLGHDVTWDTSKVRPMGAPLKKFGGRASGPKPLVDCFEMFKLMLTKHRGRKLSALNCHDLFCKIAEVIVVGGVRRSALISLSDLHHGGMKGAKDGQFWINHKERALANNSAVYTHKPTSKVFMEEWLSLAKSGTGERGIFNISNLKNMIPKRRDHEKVVATNPCFSYETRVLTKEGYYEIGELVGKDIEVWNGESWEKTHPFSTGLNELLEVKMSDGVTLRCTPYHEFCVVGGERVKAEDLVIGTKLEKFEMPVVESHPMSNPSRDAYSQGFYSGDGNTGLKHSWLYEPKFKCANRLHGDFSLTREYNGVSRKTWKHGDMLDKNYVPINTTIRYRLDWLAGVLDADGCVTRDKNGNGLQLTSVNKDFLLETKLMLTTLGVRAKVVKGNSSGMKLLPDGKGGSKEYLCQETHRLLIGNMDTYSLLGIGLSCTRLELHNGIPQRDARRFVTITEVVETGDIEETYCFTEKVTNRGTFEGVVTGQCGEIFLRKNGLCNLSEVVIRKEDTMDTLMEKMKIATIIGTIQSLITNFGKFVSPEWKKNCEEERLLGVSLTGQMDNPDILTPENLQELQDYCKGVNTRVSRKLGIKRSASTTTCKPSGTVSQLVDSSSGFHPRFSPYYLRRVRIAGSDPLYKMMVDQGVKFEPENGQTVEDATTWVCEFPVASPKDCITVEDVTAIEQLEQWLKLKENYTEHTVSATIYVKEDEWFRVGSWVYDHFDRISGVSFLPKTDHIYPLAPYHEITKEDYKRYKKEEVKIDYNKLPDFEKEDEGQGAKALSCEGDKCELTRKEV